MVGGYTIFLPRELVETDVAVRRGRHAHRADGRRAQQRRAARRMRLRRADECRRVVIPVTPFAQNCSLVWCPRTLQAAVIDPGGDLDQILAAGEKARRHADQDPADPCAHRPRRRHGASSRAARSCRSSGRTRATGSGSTASPSRAACSASDTASRSSPTSGSTKATTCRWATWSSTVRHCPGHTPGHVIFYSAADSIAFVGDVLFAGFDRPHGFPGRRLRHADPLDPRTSCSRSATTCASCRGTARCRRSGRSAQSNPFAGDAAVGIRGG